MSYGRKTMMDGLRKAGSMLQSGGKKLLDLDEAYAQKVGESIDARRQPLAEMTRAVPIKHLLAPSTASNKLELAMDMALVGTAGSANLAARYALPAGGVTLAGKALYDLTTQFGGVADQPQPNELTL